MHFVGRRQDRQKVAAFAIELRSRTAGAHRLGTEGEGEQGGLGLGRGASVDTLLRYCKDIGDDPAAKGVEEGRSEDAMGLCVEGVAK